MGQTFLSERVRNVPRCFLPAWLFPFLLIGVAVVGEMRGTIPPILVIISTAAFFAAGFCYIVPFLLRRVSLWQAAYYGMVLPFLIWAVLVFLKIIIVNKVLGIGHHA